MPEGIDTVVEWVRTAGVVGILVLVIVGMLREWIVPGTVYRRDVKALEKRVEFWQSMAMRQVDQTGRLIGITERVSS